MHTLANTHAHNALCWARRMMCVGVLVRDGHLEGNYIGNEQQQQNIYLSTKLDIVE